MKKTMVAGIALASTILSFNAFAGTAGDTNPGSDNHVYAEVAGGYSKLHDINFQSIGLNQLDDSGFGFSARVGMNFATDNSWGWGYEVGYFNLPQAEAKLEQGASYVKFKIKQQGIDLLATLNKQVNEKVGLFAKAGIAVVKQENKVEAQIYQYGTAQQDGSNVLPEIAGGVSVNLTGSVALTGTVNHLFGKTVNIDANTDDIASSTSAMLGLRLNIT